VTEQVVDGFEAVEVDEQHGGVLTGADDRVELLEQHRPGGEASERIVADDVLQLLAGPVQLGDIVGGDHQSGDDGVVEQVDDLEADRPARQRAAGFDPGGER
jgi:hypothetical protein